MLLRIQYRGAAKVFAKRRLGSSWQIEGVPGFITTTHRDECSLCEQYTEHAVAASKKPTVEILSHRIELAFQTAWPQVVERIEDDAMDEAHGKLSWYRNRYQDTVKNAMSLQEQLDSQKEHRRKAESKLHDLRKEVKGKGKQKETSASMSCKWREWESTSDSDIAEKTLSKSSRDGPATQVCQTFPQGTYLSSPTWNPSSWGHIQCPPLSGQLHRQHQSLWYQLRR